MNDLTKARYYVDIDEADDPESARGYIYTTQELHAALPMFAPLFYGDGTESLVYTHELTRYRISPVMEDDA